MEPGATDVGKQGLGRGTLKRRCCSGRFIKKGKQSMSKLFEGKVALVTGGGSGIGRAAALAFAEADAKVVVSGRREAEGFETIALIKKAGGQGTFVRGDVSNEADVEKVIAQTLKTYGRLDAAFNNAG